MNAYMAHYIIAQKLLTEGFIQQTDIENKHILLISDNGVGRQMGVNECEYIEQYLQEHGAKECIVLDMIDLERISMEKFDPNEHFYGNHDKLSQFMKEYGGFETIILMDGLERVASFRNTAANLKRLSLEQGTIYALVRTPSDVTGGPVSIPLWHEDTWRYEPETVSALFQGDEPVIQTIGVGSRGQLQLLFIRMKNLVTPESILLRQIPMYSCRAGRRILEEELNQHGYFKETELDTLGAQYGTDKSHYNHNYLNKYEAVLKRFRDASFTLLELGVFDGSSVRMWKDYFQQAQIIGVDIEQKCKQYEQDRIRIEIADLGEIDNLKNLLEYHPMVIIDDASHLWSHQLKALFTLFDAIPSGGVYIIEDMGTSTNPIVYPGYNDYEIDTYTMCERLMRVVTSRIPCQIEPWAEEITRIGLMTEMAAVIKGSFILIKK